MKKALSCAQCGAKMRAGIKFCSKCGYRLIDAEAEAVAVAAQAEEAAANLLTEEELAALAVAEPEASAAPETTPAAVDAAVTPDATSEEGTTIPRVVQKEIDHGEKIVHKTKVSADRSVARLASKGNAEVARVEKKSAVLRQETQNATKAMAARRDHNVAGGERKAARIDARSADRITAMQLVEDKKAAKRRAEESKRNFRAVADVTARDAARSAREERRAIAGRRFESSLADVRDAAEATLVKRREKEALRTEKVVTANRKEDLSNETKSARARAKALRAEEKKSARYRREEENAVVRERVVENNLHARRVKAEKAKLKQRAVADERMQSLRLSDELKTAKRLFAEREKATRVILKEEGKISNRSNDELRRTAEEKAFDNRLYAKQTAADARARKRRQSDVQRVAAKQAAVRERETKRLGSIEYKAATLNLSAEAAEARRQANLAEREMQSRREEQKLNEKEAAAEKRLIRLRAADRQKHSKTKMALRAKETRALGRAEMRALRVTTSEEAMETRRKTDEVKLHIDQKTLEDKLYARKLAAERRMIRVKAGDDGRLQQEEIKNRQMLHEAQMLEESRASRIRTDDTKRAVRDQKKQDELYQRKKSSDDKIFAREHKLDLKRTRAESVRDARVMTQKEKEQRKNLKLVERYEKEAVKRARKIAKISGVPVSLVPALSGDSSPTALLTGGGVTEVGSAALHDPDALLASSYETNREQYLAYKKKKKKEASRLRYVEIGIRNDRKYFNTIYQNGEVMVAKRTIYVARIQAILAILLMIATLVASILPIATLGWDAVPNSVYESVLDNQPVVSFESILTTEQSDPTDPVAYVGTFLSKLMAPDFAQKAIAGVTSFLNSYTVALGSRSLHLELGSMISFLFLALAVLLTPILLLINLLIAIIRLCFRFSGKGVGITRVMKNLRASFSLIGFYLLPLVALRVAKFETGFFVLVGAFGAAVLLNFFLNLIKKYEKGDRKYIGLIQLGGVLRAAILAGLFLMLHMGGVFNIALSGSRGTNLFIGLGILAVAYVFFHLATLSIPSIGFEVVGYTKGHSLRHTGTVILGLLGCILVLVPSFLGLEPPMNPNVIIAAVMLIVFVVVTLVFGLARRIVIKRYNLIDPLLDAIEEGYPLK